MSKLLVIIINHNENENAIRLKKQFAGICDTILLDSGSEMKEEEKPFFDHVFGNIYYSGLLNEAFKVLTIDGNYKYLLVITSDVQVLNSKQLVNRISQVLKKPKNGVYAPTVDDSAHPHMEYKDSGGLRKVAFVEGFCFAVKSDLLAKVCPINTDLNRIGHAVDMYIGYMAMCNGLYSLADDAIKVIHPRGSGYSDTDARNQRDRWMNTMTIKAKLFHWFVAIDIFKNRSGYIISKSLMWLMKPFAT